MKMLRKLFCLLMAACCLGAALAEDAPPIGDAGLRHEAVVPMYLPSLDGQRLLAFYETMTLSYEQHPAETVLRALLAHPGNSRVRPIGGAVPLSLTGSDPVEVSGGVCTVNLSASALQLSMEQLHTAALAIAATLCELPEISYVNVMVSGTPVAMDIGGVLPLGTLSGMVGQDLPVLWEQLTARRAPVGSSPSLTPLTATAALYVPLKEGGICAAARRLSFPGQDPGQLAQTLLHAMSRVTDVPNACDLPDLSQMLLSMPEVTDLQSGGKRITLHFEANVEKQLATSGCDAASAFAAAVYTLTTFIPSLQQVCILTGDTALTSLYSNALGSMLFPSGLHERTDYAHALMAQQTVYLPDGDALAAKTVSAPYRMATSPRAWLLELGRSALPEGLTDADILGLRIAGDTLHINLSDRYADIIRKSDADQRLMAYGIVNTLCGQLGTRRVRFTFGSKAVEHLNGDTCWDGDFLYNPDIIRP